MITFTTEKYELRDYETTIHNLKWELANCRRHYEIYNCDITAICTKATYFFVKKGSNKKWIIWDYQTTLWVWENFHTCLIFVIFSKRSKLSCFCNLKFWKQSAISTIGNFCFCSAEQNNRTYNLNLVCLSLATMGFRCW